jgi:putative ABC transport system permease protein
VQRDIQEFKAEPMMAIIPGVALAELWNGISYAEDALRVVSIFVVIVGILGLLVALLTSLNERRREMAILRVMGAGARRIIGLLILETTLLTLGAIALGLAIVYGGLSLSQATIESYFGLYIPVAPLQFIDFVYLGALILSALVVTLVPAWQAYRRSLADGLSVKV